VLYREAFRTPDGRAPFVSPAHHPEPSRSGGLELVVGGRATDASSVGAGERQVWLHPDDTSDRDVDDGDQIQVVTDDAAVEGTAILDDAVRRGTVYLRASTADPLERSGGTTVSVRNADPVDSDDQ